jgi:hypothetical protein
VNSLFDRYIAVDWSASNAPKLGKDSVWVCVVEGTGRGECANPRTRGQAAVIVQAALRESVRLGQRVLVGFDFPYGYPRGLADALQIQGPSWRSVWRHLADAIEDDPLTNANNRFDVAAAINRRLGRHVFWGRPRNSPALERLSEDLSVGKSRCRFGPDGSPLCEYREVERVLCEAPQGRERRARPHSAWQLTGAGCVGGQALTGIPVLQRLLRDDLLAEVSAVWPFQIAVPDYAPGHASVVHAEIYPSLFGADARPGQVRDEAQVVRAARELRRRDRSGSLADLFAAPLAASAGARSEEGWILGVAGLPMDRPSGAGGAPDNRLVSNHERRLATAAGIRGRGAGP